MNKLIVMNQIRKVVITGPTGAVGVALIEECIKQNIEVYAIVRQSSTRIKNIPDSKLVHKIICDLSNLDNLSKLINEKIDIFFHLGWNGTFGKSREDVFIQEKNIEYSLEAARVAAKLKADVFIGVGSQSECGHVTGKMGPTTPCNPTTCYGIAKLGASMLTRKLCKELGLKHIWIRILSLYGPCDGSYTFVSSSLNKLQNEKTFEVTKCEQLWSYIYSKDAARAFLLVAQKGKNNSIYYFGGEQVRPLKEFLLDMKHVLKSECEIKFGAIPYYPNQAMRLEADMSNLYEDTGFKHEYDFKEGIIDLLNIKK